MGTKKADNKVSGNRTAMNLNTAKIRKIVVKTKYFRNIYLLILKNRIFA